MIIGSHAATCDGSHVRGSVRKIEKLFPSSSDSGTIIDLLRDRFFPCAIPLLVSSGPRCAIAIEGRALMHDQNGRGYISRNLCGGTNLQAAFGVISPVVTPLITIDAALMRALITAFSSMVRSEAIISPSTCPSIRAGLSKWSLSPFARMYSI